MKRVLFLVVSSMVAVVLGGCGQAPPAVERPIVRESAQSTEAPERFGGTIVGVKIQGTERDFEGLFVEWRALGINTVFATEELSSSGGFRAVARKRGIDLFLVFPALYAPDQLAEDPDLWAITASGARAKEDRLEFACPSRTDFRAQRVEEARNIVRRLRPEGLSIDFIHHFVFWEMVGPDRDPATLPDTCYCVHCLQAFAASLGLPAGSIPPQPQRAATWIASNAAEEWVRFKVETVAAMVADIAHGAREVEPEILINVHVIPWRRDDYDGAIVRVAGQDPAVLSETADYVSPMTYSFMLQRPPEWVASVVQDLDRESVCPVLPTIQVAPAYRDDKVFSASEFEATLRAALEPPSAGVVFSSWDHIEADPGRAEIIRNTLIPASGDQ